MANDVKIKIAVDNSGVSTGLAQVRANVNEFKKSASASFKDLGKDFAGIFAATALIGTLKEVGDSMERTQRLAQRFGESAESIQRVSQAANQTGADMETVGKAMVKVNTSAVEAIKGSKELSDSFSELGINAQSFTTLPMEGKLEALADGYEHAQGSAEKMAAIQKILGRGGAELIPLLEQGSAALKNQFDSATVASNQTVASIAQANERLTKVFDNLKVFVADAMGFVIKGVTEATRAFAVLETFVANLPHGFKAAQAAVDDMGAAIKAARLEDEQAAQTVQPKTEGNEAQIQANKDQEDAEESLQALRDENNQKLWDAHERTLSLLSREQEIYEQMAKLDGEMAAAKKNKDESGELKASSAKLDLQKELEENLKKQSEDSKKDIEEEARLKEKAAKEEISYQERLNQEKLTDAEKKLSDLEKRAHSFSVDSMRAIGGGIVGVNYQRIGRQEDSAQKALNLQKQAVDHLKNIEKKLEDKSRGFDGGGNFNL